MPAVKMRKQRIKVKETIATKKRARKIGQSTVSSSQVSCLLIGRTFNVNSARAQKVRRAQAEAESVEGSYVNSPQEFPVHVSALSACRVDVFLTGRTEPS